jgi:Recombination endonuclease VII
MTRDDQPSLFDTVWTPRSPQPQCAPCGEPVRWRPRLMEWAPYCGGNQCVNPVRICRYCNKKFRRDDGGTRYCSPEHREAWTNRSALPNVSTCPIEGTSHKGKNRWHLCAEHLTAIRPAIRALSAHNVSTDLVVALIKDPTCATPGCEAQLLEYETLPLDHKPRLTLCVDHDHDCCKGPHSRCGMCVRGLICWRCNTALGMADNSASRLEGLAVYLRGWEERGQA